MKTKLIFFAMLCFNVGFGQNSRTSNTILTGIPPGANGTNTAAIIVFDLNGLLIKNYPINSNQSELTIKSADIGRGYFIYSLVQNGQELITKKMIVQ